MRVPVPATVFAAGAHEIRIWIDGERWIVALDGARLEHWFRTQAEAWVAGVSEADRVDRERAAHGPPPT